MSDKKLLIVLIVVIIVQCIMTLTHPAYRYYRVQAEQLREDYIRFEKKVRDDFIPALTNIVNNVPRGTSLGNITENGITKSVITENGITKSVITENGITKDVITKSVREEKPPLTEISGYAFSVNGKMGVFCNGFSYFVGDFLLGSEILDIDAYGVLLYNGYVKFTKDVITKDVITKDVITESENRDTVVRQCPDVWFGDYY